VLETVAEAFLERKPIVVLQGVVVAVVATL